MALLRHKLHRHAAVSHSWAMFSGGQGNLGRKKEGGGGLQDGEERGRSRQGVTTFAIGFNKGLALLDFNGKNGICGWCMQTLKAALASDMHLKSAALGVLLLHLPLHLHLTGQPLPLRTQPLHFCIQL